MGRIQQAFINIREYKYTKYIVTLAFFVLIVGFLDENSLWNRKDRLNHIKALQEEIAILKKQYAHDTKRLESLDDYNNTVRIAREDYLMKRPDEDVFIIIND